MKTHMENLRLGGKLISVT